MQKAQDRYADNANKKRKDGHKYQLDDYVMLRNFYLTRGVSLKLIPRFKGPFEVVKVLRNDQYVVADVEDFQGDQVTSVGTKVCGNQKICICGIEAIKFLYICLYIFVYSSMLPRTEQG